MVRTRAEPFPSDQPRFVVVKPQCRPRHNCRGKTFIWLPGPFGGEVQTQRILFATVDVRRLSDEGRRYDPDSRNAPHLMEDHDRINWRFLRRRQRTAPANGAAAGARIVKMREMCAHLRDLTKRPFAGSS